MKNEISRVILIIEDCLKSRDPRIAEKIIEELKKNDFHIIPGYKFSEIGKELQNIMTDSFKHTQSLALTAMAESIEDEIYLRDYACK